MSALQIVEGRLSMADTIATEVESFRESRVASACCGGTGSCGIDDCRLDAAVIDALAHAESIARYHAMVARKAMGYLQ